MKLIPSWLVVLLLSVCDWSGCQAPKATRVSHAGCAAASAIRDNSGSLLYQLLNDEKKVSLLRFIKRERAEIRELIRRISDHSAAGAKQLEEFARRDPAFRLDDLRLPAGEEATGAAIAATRRKELLGQTGGEFELPLMLTQAQALGYATHLAKVAGENESHPDRARALAGISTDMEQLYQEVLVHLRANPE